MDVSKGYCRLDINDNVSEKFVSAQCRKTTQLWLAITLRYTSADFCIFWHKRY